MCLASPQDPLPYLPAAPRSLKRPSLSQAQPEPIPAHTLPCQGHTSLPSTMLHTGDVRTHVPDSKETGRARDTRSRGAKEHSQKALAIHSLPLGQTLGSAAALVRNQGTHGSPSGSLSWPAGTQGRPHSSLQGCGHPYRPSRGPTRHAG